MVTPTQDVHLLQTESNNPNDLLRNMLVQLVITMAPIIIKNYLSDEMINALLARLTQRIKI